MTTAWQQPRWLVEGALIDVIERVAELSVEVDEARRAGDEAWEQESRLALEGHDEALARLREELAIALVGDCSDGRSVALVSQAHGSQLPRRWALLYGPMFGYVAQHQAYEQDLSVLRYGPSRVYWACWAGVLMRAVVRDDIDDLRPIARWRLYHDGDLYLAPPF